MRLRLKNNANIDKNINCLKALSNESALVLRYTTFTSIILRDVKGFIELKSARALVCSNPNNPNSPQVKISIDDLSAVLEL